MPVTYKHFEVETIQSSKNTDSPCGDVVGIERTAAATVMVVSDGIGAGVKANIAATMAVSRLLESFRQGFTLREGFGSLVNTMNRIRGADQPYAVFTVARILSDGSATVLSYEMPPAIFVGLHHATPLTQRTQTLKHDIIGEAHCHLEPGEGLILVSDGITQAGMGMGLPWGWTSEGVAGFVTDRLTQGVRFRDLPAAVHSRARELWRSSRGDDCTVTGVFCRPGKTVNVLTGPPSHKSKDFAVIQKFLLADGVKVVCGATTSKLVAAHLGTTLQVEQNAQSMLAPPRYVIAGIDLVTEGAVTLTQVYNILGEDPTDFEEESGVSELCELLMDADRINFTVGVAQNPASESISFRQQGILSRSAIVPFIGDKLQKAGKLVVVEYV
jgi:hypothetical protein